MQPMFELLPEKLRQPFKAVVFDMDGTLFDSEELHFIAFREAMKEYGYDFDAASEGFAYEGSFRKLYANVAKKLDFDEDEYNTIYNRKVEITLEYSPHEVDFVDGVVSFLEMLQDLSIPMAVVTNSDREYAEHMLVNHELTPFFEHTLTASELESEVKPHPGGYIKASSLLMIDPVDILVFENTDAGIAAAKSAGMKVIAIRTTDENGISTYDDADYAIDSFADITLNELEFTTNNNEPE